MSEHTAENDALDALARALCKAGGKVYWTEAFPAVYRDQARALLADGWRVIPPDTTERDRQQPWHPASRGWVG